MSAHVRMRATPIVRSPDLAIDGEIPRDWFGGNVFATHVANGVGMLFPAGERFFVRSVNAYLDRVDDRELVHHVKRFFSQEGRHAREHDRTIRLLEEQGYDVDRFLALYERVAYGFIERVSPPALRLSTTAACEHYTALLAEDALRHRFLDHAHPTMRALLKWHAAEEIEHRAVAFDVLQVVAPSYALRMAGLAMATLCLGGFWTLATLSLLSQERKLTGRRWLRDFLATRAADDSGVFVRGIRAYMRPGFHPLEQDLDALADGYLDSVGLPRFAT